MREEDARLLQEVEKAAEDFVVKHPQRVFDDLSFELTIKSAMFHGAKLAIASDRRDIEATRL